MRRVILHIEDDENDVLLMEFAMGKAGIVDPVQIASDGQMAIDYLNGNGEFDNRNEFPLPYLILLDLKLPQVPGLEVLKWIRQEADLKIPVVILTSSQSSEDVAAAYDLGANAYLVKPSDTVKLAELAKSIKDFWLTQNTPPPVLPGIGPSESPPLSESLKRPQIQRMLPPQSALESKPSKFTGS
jgi:two-component system response regulator